MSKCTLAEIERKRQEAKAIRERKVLARPKSSTDIVNDGNLPSSSRKFQHRNQSLEFQNICKFSFASTKISLFYHSKVKSVGLLVRAKILEKFSCIFIL